jgi:hypothetical protein
METPTRLHHVTNGDALSAKLAAAQIPGSVSTWSDILHEGPVPEGQSHDQLSALRARYVADAGYGAYEDLATSFRQAQGAIDRPTYDELVLWYEHDLFDQLNLIQLLDRIAVQERRVPVSLVSIDSFPGYPRFHGMGELTPEEIAGLFPARKPVTDTQIALAQRAWAAFRAPAPTALEQFLDTDTGELPFLAPALQRHLEEFPSERNGLSRTEQQLLELVEPRPLAIIDAFRGLAEQERWFFIGDSSFWTVVVRLATSTPALVDVEIIEASNHALPHGTIRITDVGRDVMNGCADRIGLYGIDRWLGGVHVTAASSWRRRATATTS